MAYQTGTATNIIDLLDKLRAFALGLGWTINRFDSGTDGWLSLYHADAGYFNLRDGGSSELDMRGATGYAAGSAWGAQPGVQAADTITNRLTGPFTAYHFYGATQYLHVVVEITPNRFRHFHVGKLDAIGTWAGGEYVCGTYWNQNAAYIDDPDSPQHGCPFDGGGNVFSRAKLRTDIDAQGSIWRDFINWHTVPNGTYARGFLRPIANYAPIPDGQTYRATPNTFNGITPLLPGTVYLDRAGDSVRFSPSGYAPDLRAVSMRNLVPGQQITIGADVWDCYPLIRRTDEPSSGSDTENSYHYGIAYKRIA